MGNPLKKKMGPEIFHVFGLWFRGQSPPVKRPEFPGSVMDSHGTVFGARHEPRAPVLAPWVRKVFFGGFFQGKENPKKVEKEIRRRFENFAE